MKRMLIVGLMAIAAVTTFAGGEGEAADSSDVVVITEMTEWVGEHLFAAYAQSERERFEAEFGDRIRLEVDAAPDRENMLPVRIAAGNLPDVFVLNRTDTARQAVDAGLLTDMTPYLEADPEWMDDLSTAFLDYWSAATGTPDQRYGITSHGDLIPIFYNTAIFEEVGITPPTTWDEFWANAEALKAAGYAATSQGGFISDLWLLGLIGTQSEAGNEWANEVIPTNWELPFVIDGLADLQRMLQDYSTPDAAGLDYGGAMNYFMNEASAMVSVGTWAVAGFSNPDQAAEGLSERVGVMTFPGNGIGQNPGYAYFNAGKTQETQDAVAEYIKFMNDREGQTQKLRLQNLPPTSPNIDFDSLGLNQILIEVLNAVPGTVSTGWPHRTLSAGLREIYTPQLAGLATGATTPEELAKVMTEAASR